MIAPNSSARRALAALASVIVVAACAPPMPAEASAKDAKKRAAPAAAAAAAAAASVQTPAPAAGVAAKTVEEMRARLEQTMPDIQFDEVRTSVLPGFFEVQRGANFGYISADGQYLLTGDLINVATGEQITENARKAGRLAALDKLSDSYIEFAPKAGAKQVVTVFTDIDCGYCRKLHAEMDSYNALGISIRYAFFPRSGPGSPSFEQAKAVACSTDRKGAMTLAKQGSKLPPAPAGCKDTVQAEYDLGLELGLRGTPMMVLPDGEIVNGYMPAASLAGRLASSGFPAAAGKSAP